jgi:hypothetical protein
MATTKSEAQPATRKAQAGLDRVNADRRAAALSGKTAEDIYRGNVAIATTQKNWTRRKDVSRTTD